MAAHIKFQKFGASKLTFHITTPPKDSLPTVDVAEIEFASLQFVETYKLIPAVARRISRYSC